MFGLILVVVAVTPVQAHNLTTPHSVDERLAHEGFFVDQERCGPGYRIEGTDLCSHGPDAAPPGLDPARPVPPLDGSVQASGILCDGDGVSGKRVQILYVRAEDDPDRYAEYVESIRQWAAEMDDIFATSARLTGGYRRIRFVTDPNCLLDVPHVVVPPGATATFRATMAALIELGHTSEDRKYVAFVDARVYCGIATVSSDPIPTPDNHSNHRTGYARIDQGCWSGSVAAHELVHNLGGVQPGAPNASGGWHCVDEFDLMCYSDGPFYPSLKYVCPVSYAIFLDCNHDDYYHTDPPAGSYLATQWNVADSAFLIATAPQQNSPPTIDLLLHNGDEPLVAPATLTVTVEASDDDGVVTGVEFYEGANLLHRSTTHPYSFTWREMISGTYTMTVTVYDDTGDSTTSDPLSIVVTAPPVLPSDQEEDSDQQEDDEPQVAEPLFLPFVVRE
ncbi:MAG: hypothetical protein DCC55_32970 [Chloroflexi bacterium]|nr:MAG: hypothetical protein DCC55_32970 [Chloroflexota bacterium]